MQGSAPPRRRAHDARAVRPEREFVDGGGAGIDAESDFAKRLERGKLSFTGDVLQVISVSAVSKSLISY